MYFDVLSQCVGRDSNPDTICAMMSDIETRHAKGSLSGLIEKSRFAEDLGI
jgi:hypothetical protein